MTPFRGSDERLDREIETLEGIARVRVRRVGRELRDIEKDLHELRRERARRRAAAETPTMESTRGQAEA